MHCVLSDGALRTDGVPEHGKNDELMQLGAERSNDERVQICMDWSLSAHMLSSESLCFRPRRIPVIEPSSGSLSLYSGKLSRAIGPRRTSLVWNLQLVEARPWGI